MRPIPPSSIFTDDTHSVAQYTPTSEMDYGSLLCWGHNNLGLQEQPCVFSVLPAGNNPGNPELQKEECTIYSNTYVQICTLQ